MTRKENIKKDVAKMEQMFKELKELQNNKDYEVAHSKADDILCEYLKILGMGAVVKEYDKITKYYA